MLLADPLASAMWPALGWTFFGLFAGSFTALLITARGQWRQLTGSVLFKRWRTWAMIAPMFSLAALAGPLAMALFAAALAAAASREYSRLAGLRTADARLLMLAALTVPLAAIAIPPMWLALLMPLVASAPTLLQQDVRSGPKRVGQLAFGLWYAPLTLSLLVALEQNEGPMLVLALSLATALSDVGAFTAGKLFGRYTPLLANRLSPSKTIAGVGGNLLGASLGLLLLQPDAVVLAPVVTIGAVWGDLLESLFKRAAGAKDAGNCLPGFGGVLDRLDSMLVVLPLTFAALAVLP